MATGQLVLVGISSAVDGLSWRTEERLRIGREANLEIVVHEPSLERKHAEIRVTPRGWVVQDFGSGTNTLLNGIPVGKLTKKLQVEDVLQCGKLSFKVNVLEWQPPAPSPTSGPLDIKTSGPIVRIQAFSKLSWEQGLRGVALEEVPVPHAKQFLTLLRAGYHLSQIDSVNELLQTLLDDTVAVLNAQRGAILLSNNSSDQLVLKCHSGTQDGGRGYSNTLAQRCFSKGESLLCLDHLAEAPASTSIERGNMTSIICALLRSPRRRLGVLHLDRGPRQEPFSQDDFKLADAVAATVSVGIESAVAVDKQRSQFLQEVVAFAKQFMAIRDESLGRHCERVANISSLLADEIGLSSSEKEELRLGALLHDIGKIGLSDKLVLKRGQLDANEEQEQRQHTLHGVRIAEKISGFAPAVPIIRSHHECWDGSGFPDRLKADQIPRLARIVAVADAVDEMTDLQADVSRDEIFRQCHLWAGTQFDPQVVAALHRLDARLEEVLRGQH